MCQHQSREKIAAFFQEFPFLTRIVKERKTCEVKVSRVNLATVKAQGDFYVFDRQGVLLGETSALWDRTLNDTLNRLGIQNMGCIVEKTIHDPSYGGYGFFSWLMDFVSSHITYSITVFKAPKDFDPAKWLEEERRGVQDEVRNETAQAGGERLLKASRRGYPMSGQAWLGVKLRLHLILCCFVQGGLAMWPFVEQAVKDKHYKKWGK